MSGMEATDRSSDLDQRSLRDQLIDSLRARIVSSELSQGERLDLQQIARNYEVSPIPVREAMIVLESEGVVSTRARRGVFVAAPANARIVLALARTQGASAGSA